MNAQWIPVKAEDGGQYEAYLSLPPAGKGPGLVLFQEIFGVNRHIRAVADQYALDGFVVLAPDLFWRVQAGAEFDDSIQLKEIDPASKTVPKPDALPYERMQRGEIRAQIDKAIDQLTPEHRAVILMKEIEDMQYHEIAEALGCSIGTVMSRLFYARKKLQNLLSHLYENI